MKKGDLYATLVIRIPIVAREEVDDEYAEHIADEYVPHAAKAIIGYSASCPLEPLRLDKGKATFDME